MQEVILFVSAARTATLQSAGFRQVHGIEHQGLWLSLDVTAAGGTTPTLDVIIERFDPASSKWVALPGAVFAQITGVSSPELTIHPAMTAAANVVVKEPIGDLFRAVATIGGTSPTFTFSLGGQLLH